MKKFLVASTPSDSHTWNLVYLQLLLEEYGHEVVNAGSCAASELVIDRCRRERPDYLVISSVNGHGYQDGLKLAAAVRARPDLDGISLIIGGKLNTRDADATEMSRALRDAGYDHVFQGESAVSAFRALLESIEAPVAAPLFSAPIPLFAAAA